MNSGDVILRQWHFKTTMEKTNQAVVFQDVSKSFGQVNAVRELNFNIEPGQLITLLGPSGCGKTTTFRLIAGLEMVSNGKIFIGGKDVTHVSASDRDVSMVFQSYALYPHMSVKKNLSFGLENLRIDKSEIEERIKSAAKLLRIEELMARRPGQLSGGQRQRVVIARALAIKPKVIILDESVASLDISIQAKILNLLNNLKEKGVIFVESLDEIPQGTKQPVIFSAHGVAKRVIEKAKDYAAEDADITFRLYKKFCPGPLTFILNLKKSSKISKIITNKKNTLAVRFPRHSVTRRLLKILEFPLAAPSANPSSRVSAVTSNDVKEDFGKKIKYVLEGGRSSVGVESTIIDLRKKPKILRLGGLEVGIIQKILKKKISINTNHSTISAPGQLKIHYSPGIPIRLNVKKIKKDEAFLLIKKNKINKTNYYFLSKKGDLKEAAKNLYTILRKIKKDNYKSIAVDKIPNIGIGKTINDRLLRASKF